MKVIAQTRGDATVVAIKIGDLGIRGSRTHRHRHDRGPVPYDPSCGYRLRREAAHPVARRGGGWDIVRSSI